MNRIECGPQIKLATIMAIGWYCGICDDNGASCENCRVYDMGVYAGINEPTGETNETD
jgi:hypothetical protein